MTPPGRYALSALLKSLLIGWLPLAAFTFAVFFASTPRGLERAKKKQGERDILLEKALADCERFAFLVDGKAPESPVADDAPVPSGDAEASPHLVLDYSWSEDLEDAIATANTHRGGEEFLVLPEQKEFWFVLKDLDDEARDELKMWYARYRVLPFVSDGWTRWCLLGKEERRSLYGAFFMLFFFWGVALTVISLVYFFAIREWCDVCDRCHWVGRCPRKTPEANRANLKNALSALGGTALVFAALGFANFKWKNVAETVQSVSETLSADGVAEEDAEAVGAAALHRLHDVQLDLLRKRDWVPLSEQSGDPREKFVKAFALGDLFASTVFPPEFTVLPIEELLGEMEEESPEEKGR